MTSLKARFALLAGSAGLLVVLAAGGLFWALSAAENAVERTLAAQQRLDLLAELSGRLSSFGLVVVDAVSQPQARTERIAAARADVEQAIAQIDARLAQRVAGTEGLLGRTEFAARSRPLARLGAAMALLNRQIEGALAQPDPIQRGDQVRGALNAFGATTGPSLSFLIDAERRGIVAASDEARILARRLRVGAGLAALAALMAVLLMHRALTRPVMERLAAVGRAAGAIGRGELDTRLAFRGRDEFALLMARFNRMAARLARRERRVAEDRASLEETIAERTAALRAANERLEDVDRSRRRFFADVSHELRTPLTVILGECDIGLRAPDPSPGLQPVLATIRKRAQGLQRRVEDLLRVARSESGQLELDFRPVSLLDVVSEAVDTLSPQAARRGIVLELEPGPTDAEVMADPEWLRQIVEGLIDNALRHGGSLTRIVVRLAEADGGARIAVEDDGRGFPEDRERLFERFGRGADRADGSRSEGPGFGIGLALARWVVERHNGSIAIDGPGEGRRGGRVTVTLPADRKEDAA